MLDKFNERLNHYEIKECEDCLGEDQKMGATGYAVVNTGNNIKEFTTQVLPTAIFQADYLDQALQSLLDKDDTEEPTLVMSDDVMLN
jgi:hypothetical protein